MSIFSVVARKFHSARKDLQYGKLLIGSGESAYTHLGVTGTVSSGYDVLPSLFEGQVRPNDVLVDVGCGRGRVLNWWLDTYRDHRIYGLEIDPELAHETRQRLHRFRNATVLTGDACENLPPDGSLFYLYNPFERPVMKRFIDALLARAPSPNGLPTRVVYYNSLDASLFDETGAFVSRPLKPIHSFAHVIDRIVTASSLFGMWVLQACMDFQEASPFVVSLFVDI